MAVTAAMIAAAVIATAASLRASSMFASAAMAGLADMPLSIACFVGLEMIERPIPVARHRASISVPRIEAIIDVTVEAPVAMEPRPCSNE